MLTLQLFRFSEGQLRLRRRNQFDHLRSYFCGAVEFQQCLIMPVPEQDDMGKFHYPHTSQRKIAGRAPPFFWRLASLSADGAKNRGRR